jgi:hypothetical protein
VGDIPWWLTAGAGAFALAFAILALVTSGAEGPFAILAIVAVAFFVASLMKRSWLRNLLTWFSTLFTGR